MFNKHILVLEECIIIIIRKLCVTMWLKKKLYLPHHILMMLPWIKRDTCEYMHFKSGSIHSCFVDLYQVPKGRGMKMNYTKVLI
jgi:hypothetical protein